jgi:hypothetical protein
MIELNDKQKLALYKKSQSSGYSTGILEEVYLRGYNLWNESFTGNQEQFGFDRVNSFIAGGFATELDFDLLEEKKVWDKPNPKQKDGTSEKLSPKAKSKAKARARAAGRPYPNMVDNIWAARNEEYTGAEKVSKNKNNPASRFDATKSLADRYKEDTPGQTVKESRLLTIKRIISEATYKGKTVPLNKPMKGDVKKSKVFVDPNGDGKAQKVNFGDKNMTIKKHIKGNKDSYCARSKPLGNDPTKANYWSRKAWDC